jgi:predicted Co/Zn/Cd cation transporter (cation efflux family)
MPDSKQDGKKEVEGRWPHMSTVQKWGLFGGLCIYAIASAYVPLMFGGEDGRWGRATIEALTYVLFGAVLIWVLFPSVTDWIQHGSDR